LVEEIDSYKLRDYIQSHDEADYLLVDVRQPSEYEQAHIPGARLMPLPNLMNALDRLPVDKDIIFYCHVGGRSAAAATMLAEEKTIKKRIYNLSGGILAWQGGMVADYPKVRHFKNQSYSQMLQTAMDLEKGALRFYTAIGQRHADQPWAVRFSRLAAAEEGHARRIFNLIPPSERLEITFEDCFEQLSGEVLEGGTSIETALQKLASVRERPCLRLVELALQIEREAFDLYRTIADQVVGPIEKQAFLSLAQAEKSHIQDLIGTVSECP